jgi:hypothetical protein
MPLRATTRTWAIGAGSSCLYYKESAVSVEAGCGLSSEHEGPAVGSP